MAQPVFAVSASNISSRNSQNAPFNVAQAVSSLSSTANNFQASSTSTSGPNANPNIFKAPAHKHAHHLHSIPPREKSTRTLIIDYMLWVHGRTRFAQARSELGMTDRTGGPSSQNYTHRRRPENYDEEEEVGSDGENVETLKARAQPDNDDEDARMHIQDLQLARNLRLRAEGLEKVVTSMLMQTPPVHLHEDDYSPTPPTSPRIEPSNGASNPRHQHTLPNGVRLRLALGTLVNDFFARQAPRPPFRHKRYAAASTGSSPVTQTGGSSSVDEMPSSSRLPLALIPIAPVSAWTSAPKAPEPPNLDPTPGSSAHSHLYSNSPSNSQNSNYPSYTIPHTQHQHTQIQNSSTPPRYLPRQQAHLAHLHQPTPPPPSSLSNGLYNASPPQPIASSSPTKKVPLKPSRRTKKLFLAGADPDTANAPPSFRCPRHLHTACEICVEAKSKMGGKPQPPTRGRSGTTIPAGAGAGGLTDNLGASTSTRTGQTWNSSWKGVPIGIAPDGGGVSGWQDGSGIGSGLLKPALNGSVLRRKTASPYSTSGHGPGYGAEGDTDNTGSGYTKLSELLPRFLRLSALVAAELGRELKEGREDDDRNTASMGYGSPERAANRHGEGGAENEVFSPLPAAASPATARAIAAAQAQGSPSSQVQSAPAPSSSSGYRLSKFYAEALRPSREWYLLLAGLLTRAALQGYLTAGWRGTEAVDCLFTVGLGINEKRARSSSRSRGQPSAVGSVSSPSVVTPGTQEGQDDDEDDDDDEEPVDPLDEEQFEEFEPDELPSLLEAVLMLFPGLRTTEDGAPMKKSPAEEEFEEEMDERLRKFYDIPDATPDLSTHMEDLAWQYPCEPIERAVLRFCEAIAKWRGKPELETYKKKPRPSTINTTSSTPSTLESLIHSNPTTPTLTSSTVPARPQQVPSARKPSVEMYFLPPDNIAINVNSNTANTPNLNFNMGVGANSSPTTSTVPANTMPTNLMRGPQLATNRIPNAQAAQLWSAWNKRTRSPEGSRAGPSSKRPR